MESSAKGEKARQIWLSYFNRVLSQAGAISDAEAKKISILLNRTAPPPEGKIPQSSSHQPPA